MDEDPSDDERAILKAKRENPDMTDEGIAAETGASTAEVREVLEKYDMDNRKRDRNLLILLIVALIFLGFLIAGVPGGDSPGIVVPGLLL